MTARFKFKIGKYALIIVVILMVLCGCSLFVAGLLLRLNSGFFGNDVITLLNSMTYNAVKLGRMINTLMSIMLSFGGSQPIFAFCAIYGVCKKVKCCIIMFILGVALLIFAQAILVGLWIDVRVRANDWLKGEFLDKLKYYQGPLAKDSVSQGWNTMFIDVQCCGVNDGQTISDFETVSSVWASSNPTEKIPATCCQDFNSQDISNTIQSTCTTIPINYYPTGCHNKMRNMVNIYSLIVMVVCGVLLVLEIAAIIVSCFVLDQLKIRIRNLEDFKQMNKPTSLSSEDESSKTTMPPPSYIGIDDILRNKKR